MILVRHGTLEVRYADINFFPLILFLYLRDGLRRKGGDCSLSIPPETWLKTVRDLCSICNDHSKFSSLS